MASQSAKTSPAGEVPFTPEQKEKIIIGKGLSDPQRNGFKNYNRKKINEW